MNQYIIELIDKQKNDIKSLNMNYNKIIKLLEENIEFDENDVLASVQENNEMINEMINNTDDIIFSNHKINSKNKKYYEKNKKIIEAISPYILMIQTIMDIDNIDMNKLRTLIGTIMIETSK